MNSRYSSRSAEMSGAGVQPATQPGWIDSKGYVFGKTEGCHGQDCALTRFTPFRWTLTAIISAERDEYRKTCTRKYGRYHAAMQAFDPEQEFSIVNRALPHWSQAGTVTFITWRTWDSMPKKVIMAWLAERDAWLRKHGIDPQAPNWSQRVDRLGEQKARELRTLLSDRWNDSLDQCHGECVLRNGELSEIVAKSLRHFDGQRYELLDYVVMPNHVHLLAVFPDEETLLDQCDSWKHFTATQINRQLKRRGRFWETDGFDHLVRSVEQFDWLRTYIANNPSRANLRIGEFLHYSKLLSVRLK